MRSRRHQDPQDLNLNKEWTYIVNTGPAKALRWLSDSGLTSRATGGLCPRR
jgi:hypothetical protein